MIIKTLTKETVIYYIETMFVQGNQGTKHPEAGPWQRCTQRNTVVIGNLRTYQIRVKKIIRESRPLNNLLYFIAWKRNMSLRKFSYATGMRLHNLKHIKECSMIYFKELIDFFLENQYKYTRGYQKVLRLMRWNQYLCSYAYKFC